MNRSSPKAATLSTGPSGNGHTYQVPIVHQALSKCFCIFPHPVLIIALLVKFWYYSHFVDEDMKARRR